jgi:hypothetical protein
MKNSALFITGSVLLIIIIPVILFLNFNYSVVKESEGLGQSEVEEFVEPKNFEVTNVVYNDTANFVLPEKAIGFRSNPKTNGKGFIFEKEGKSYVYLIYAFSTVTKEPKISFDRDGNDLIIISELPYQDSSLVGLTAMSYHNFEIEVNGDFDKVTLKETTKTVE